MKKFTLKALGLLLVSFLGFASANAQDPVMGTWDGSAFTAGGLTDVNPNEPFNFAIQIPAGSALLTDLDATPSTPGAVRTLAITSFRYEATSVTGFTNAEIRLTPVGNHTYVLENFDAVGANPLASGLTGHLHTGFLVAEIGGDFWWANNTVDPGANYLYVGTFAVPGPSFEDNAETVDVVEIPAFNNDGAITQLYLTDLGEGGVQWTVTQDATSQWYKIPAGAVSNGTEDVQAYYFKNKSTDKYLTLTVATLTQLIAERGGDWPIEPAATTATKEEGSKWFTRVGGWEWATKLSNATGIDITAAEGNQFFDLTSITLMNGVGSEFFGVYYPNASVGGYKGGGGNAWTATKTPVVVETGVANPDYTTGPVASDFTGTIVALDPTTEEVLTTVNPNAPFIVAVNVTNEAWQALLDREYAGLIPTDPILGTDAPGFYTIALPDSRFVVGEDSLTVVGHSNTFVSVTVGRDNRLYQAPSPAPAYSYYGAVPALNNPLPAGTTGVIKFTAIIAGMGEPWAYWWNQSIADGATPTKELSINFAVPEESGIFDTLADGSTVVGYYTILGAKLTQEPENGVFIVKYSNGKAVKVVK